MDEMPILCPCESVGVGFLQLLTISQHPQNDLPAISFPTLLIDHLTLTTQIHANSADD
jgi:hypothetical protein